jgi:hypothetical protein
VLAQGEVIDIRGQMMNRNLCTAAESHPAAYNALSGSSECLYGPPGSKPKGQHHHPTEIKHNLTPNRPPKDAPTLEFDRMFVIR